MNILIVKLSALGDVVQALPVAMAIHRQLPAARVDWLVESPSAGILAGHPALHRVLVSPRQALRSASWAGLGQAAGFVAGLRQTCYDAVLDLQGLMKSAIFVTLSCGGRKIGFRGGKEPLAALALSEKLAPYDPDRHALERYLDLLEPLGLLRPARPEFGLEPTDEEITRARGLLAGWGEQRPLVLLHPMAKWRSKLWPAGHWAELIHRLGALKVDLALTGSKDDQAATAAIVAQAGPDARVTDLAGRADLKILAALQSLAAVVVSTDTGTMHLAAAVGAPVVALFGPTAPWRTGPHGGGHTVLRLGLDCQPCFRRECPQPRCLEDLQPQEVARAVESMLRRTPPRLTGPAGQTDR